MNGKGSADRHGGALEPGRSPTGSDDDLLTSAEVAALFGVDRRTVVLWAKGGRIRALRTPGGQHRFRAEEILSLFVRLGRIDDDESE